MARKRKTKTKSFLLNLAGNLILGAEPESLNPEELRLLKQARKKFLNAKNDLTKRFLVPNLSNELVSSRELIINNFENVMTLVLCKVASADGPINPREGQVLDVLFAKEEFILGRQPGAFYYNRLLKEFGGADATQVFGTVIDVAVQLGQMQPGSKYDARKDPVVKCFETLGQAVLSADGDISERELKCLSEYTAIAHSRTAELDREMKSPIRKVSQSAVPIVGKSPGTTAKSSSATLDQCIKELHALIGLRSVKQEIETLTNLARVFTLRKEKGLAVPDVSFHMVFSGNPGTGKTTVARIVAKIYGCLGLLTAGQLIEVDRSGLVGNFVGQTATKARKVIDQAKGGILFIDEAYALAKDSENDFGAEAIEVLLKSMEDYRDDLVVIAAGYTDKMAKFLGSNPGLRSRFPRSIIFPDYSAGELEEIFLRQAKHNKYILADEAGTAVKNEMGRLWQQRQADFANARDVRNLFERVVAMQANRVSGSASITTDDLTTITEADVRQACTR